MIQVFDRCRYIEMSLEGLEFLIELDGAAEYVSLELALSWPTMEFEPSSLYWSSALSQLDLDGF